MANDRKREHEPTIAPGMDTHDPTDKPATEAEKRRGDTTTVTQLYLDRTPND